MLADRSWQRKYTPDDGDLVRLFYVPALEDAERYDRLTGYFNAGALALAARGIEGLVRNRGHMRLVVGCTLPPAEIEAIERGAALRERVERHLAELPLAPPDPVAAGALELLAWMVARCHLDVKVAVPCDAERRPIPEDGIFHEKAGIVTDRSGDRLAWNGSLNETAAGWRHNWESINVYTSWGPEPKRVDDEEANFGRIWADKAKRVIVLDTPEAVRRDLMRFMPDSDLPARLREGPDPPPATTVVPTPEWGDQADEDAHPAVDLRSRVWAFIDRAPALPDGGARVGEATAAVTPCGSSRISLNRVRPPMPSSGWRVCSGRRSGSSDRWRRPMPGGLPGCRPYAPTACSARCATRPAFPAVSSKRRSVARRCPSCGRTPRSAIWSRGTPASCCAAITRTGCWRRR